MEARFHLFLFLIILGTITVQGARLGNQQENPLHVHSKRRSGEGFLFYIWTFGFNASNLIINMKIKKLRWYGTLKTTKKFV